MSKLGFLKTIYFVLLGIWLCQLSRTAAAANIFSKKAAPIYISNSLAVSLDKKERLTVFSDLPSSRNITSLRSNDTEVRVIHTKTVNDLELRSYIGTLVYTFHFSEFPGFNKFFLSSVKAEIPRKLFLESDEGSFDLENAAHAGEKCPSAIYRQAQSLFDSISAVDTCAPYRASLERLTLSYAPPKAGEVSPQAKCLNELGYTSQAAELSALLKVNDGTKLACDPHSRSSYFPANETLTFGKEILSGDENGRGNAFFHEVVHKLGIQNEDEDKQIVRCCAFPKSGSSNECELARGYQSTWSIDDFQFHSVSVLAHEYLAAKDVSIRERAELVKALASTTESLVHPEKLSPDQLAAAKAKLDRLANQVCERTRLDFCSLLLASIHESASKVTQKLVTRLGNIDKIQGSAAADPNASFDLAPITPPNLKYASETTGTAAAEKEIAKIRAPMEAAREYTSSVAQTIWAATGSTAVASAPTLPNKISDNEWSTTVQSVDAKTGEITLDLGNGVTGSASVPFADGKFGAPEVTIHQPDKPSSAIVSLPKSSDDASISLPVQGRASSKTTARNTDAAVGGGSSSEAGGAITTSAKSRPTGSSSSTSSSSAKGSADLSSTAQPPSAKISSTALKRMFSSSENPAQAISSHIEDLKSNSMMVRYGCVWYPRDFKGRELFDLDAYQGRKCGQ